MTFSVFGVGNSQWAQTYQAFPTQVALGLARAGANQVGPLGATPADAPCCFVFSQLLQQVQVLLCVDGLLATNKCHSYLRVPITLTVSQHSSDGNSNQKSPARVQDQVQICLSYFKSTANNQQHGTLQQVPENC